MELVFLLVSFLEVPDGSLSKIFVIGLGLNNANGDWNTVTTSQLVHDFSDGDFCTSHLAKARLGVDVFFQVLE